MATHAAPKPHMVSAIIFGAVLVALVYLIFGSLTKNFAAMSPIPVIYGIWMVISLFLYGRGLDKEAAEESAH